MDRLATLLFFYSERLNGPREKSIVVESRGDSLPYACSIYNAAVLTGGPPSRVVSCGHITTYDEKFL